MGIKTGPFFGGFYLRVVPNVMISFCCVLRGPRLKWTPCLVPAGGGGFLVSQQMLVYVPGPALKGLMTTAQDMLLCKKCGLTTRGLCRHRCGI